MSAWISFHNTDIVLNLTVYSGLLFNYHSLSFKFNFILPVKCSFVIGISYQFRAIVRQISKFPNYFVYINRTVDHLITEDA